jgi:hypothetical protein
MTLLNYGQPVEGITQVAYTVPDIEAAIGEYHRMFGVGPWHVRGPFTPERALYRGAATNVSLTLAMAFNGHMMIELVQQHNDAPSVYRELIDKRGHGFHHFGVTTADFDARAEAYRAAGHEMAFYDVTPVGTRVAYFDTTTVLPGMVELIEMNSSQERRY